MQFPTTLDDFNRADGALGANWSDNPFGGAPDASWAIITNRIGITSGTNIKSWYNVATYGPNCYVWAELPATPASTDSELDIYARIGSPSSGSATGYGYGLAWASYLGGIFQYYRADPGSETVLGGDETATMTAGDAFGLRIVGSSLQAWKRTSGVWATVGSPRTDATYANAGYLSIATYQGTGTSLRADNFGGGTIVRLLASTGVGK